MMTATERATERAIDHAAGLRVSPERLDDAHTVLLGCAGFGLAQELLQQCVFGLVGNVYEYMICDMRGSS